MGTEEGRLGTEGGDGYMNSHLRSLVKCAKEVDKEIFKVAGLLLKPRLSRKQRMDLHYRLMLSQARISSSIGRVEMFCGK